MAGETASRQRWALVQLSVFILLWLLPVLLTSVAGQSRIMSWVPKALASLYRLGGVFAERPESWIQYSVQAQFSGLEDKWITLDLENYSPIKNFGHENRLQKVITYSASHANGKALREHLARFLRVQHGRMFGGGPQITAVRYSYVGLKVGAPTLAHPWGRWRLPPIETIRATEAKVGVLSTHSLVNQRPPSKVHPTPLVFEAPAGLTEVELQKLATSSVFEELDLRRCKVTSNGLRALVQMSSLRKLSLEKMTLSEPDVGTLAKMTRLEALTLKHVGFVNHESAALLAKLINLRELRIPGCGLTEADWAWMVKLRNLRVLDLSETPAAASCFVVLKEWPELESLSLAKVALKDRALTSIVPHRGLKTLNLSGSQLHEAGLLYLRRFPALRELNLSNSNLSDSGAAALPFFVSLTSLDLRGTRITRKSLPPLAKLTGIKNLEALGRTWSHSELVKESPSPVTAGSISPAQKVPNAPQQGQQNPR